MVPKIEKLDPRVRRTRSLLMKALIELITEQGYKNITVKDITDRATLNRTTFYYHYKSKDDLLYQGTKNILDQMVSRQLLPSWQGENFTHQETRDALVKNFDFVAENQVFLKAMMSEQGAWEFVSELKSFHLRVAKQRLIAIRGGMPDTAVDIEILLRHLVASFVEIMCWWLENDLPYSSEKMADQVLNLYQMGLYRSLGMELSPDGFNF